MDDIKLNIMDLMNGIITSYIFWSIFHAFPAVLWFFPLNELALSGYEVFAVAYLIPVILFVPLVRSWLRSGYGRLLLKLLMLIGILSFHANTTRQRLSILCIGLVSGILRLGSDMDSFDLQNLESRIWSYPIGYIAFLTSRMFTRTQIPAWTSKDLNLVIFTLGLISAIDEWRNLVPHSEDKQKRLSHRLGVRCNEVVIGVGIGALLFFKQWIFGESSIISRWAGVSHSASGPHTATPWDAPVLACLVLGMVLSTRSIACDPLNALIALLCIYYIYYTSGWIAYIAGLYLAVFIGGIFPLFFRILATQSENIGKSLFAAMLWFTPQIFYSVWTVAYNFVPGGTLTREFSGLQIFGLMLPICILVWCEHNRQNDDPLFSNILPVDDEKEERDTVPNSNLKNHSYSGLDENENKVFGESGEDFEQITNCQVDDESRSHDGNVLDQERSPSDATATKGTTDGQADGTQLLKQRNPVEALSQLTVRENAHRVATLILMLLCVAGTLQTARRYINYQPMPLSENDPIPRAIEDGGHELKVMVWAYHFGYDNNGWPSLSQTERFFKDIDADVIVLVETDSTKPIMGNIDHTQYLAEVLNFHADFGPSPKHHTWGIALFSRYPIITSAHHLLPSPEGELAPGIEAILNVHGQQVAIFGTHFGNTEDDLDRKLQGQYASNVTSRIQMETSLPIAFLGYITSKPYTRDYKRLLKHGQLKDIDPTDRSRYCLYIMYNGMIRRSYARISRGVLSDTEVQFARFRIPINQQSYSDNRKTVTDPDEVPEDLRLTTRFGDYYSGPWYGEYDHRYHMDTPKYFV